MSSVVFLVGNGFNYLVNSFIKEIKLTTNNSNLQNIIDNINEITSLWKKFSELLDELKGNFTDLNEEELIRLIHIVLDFLSNSKEINSLLPGNQENINAVKTGLDAVITSKIVEIASSFKKHQENNQYGEISKLFPNMGDKLKSALDTKEVKKFTVFTTNYDGVIDTLLRQNNSFLADGFNGILDDPRYLKLLVKELSTRKYKCLHLHGSYRFERRLGKTYKLRDNSENNNPIMIFNNPNLKEEQIKADNVLLEYFLYLKDCFREVNKLIVIGNSLRNEPHIRELINNPALFNKTNNSLVIFDINPDDVEKQIKNSATKYNIIKKKTDLLKSPDDLINEIKSIL